MPRATFEGYGPDMLFAKVKRARWVSCIPRSRGFEGIGIGRYELTDEPGDDCNTQYRVTLENESGNVFRIEGWGFSDRYLIGEALREQNPISLADYSLSPIPSARNDKKYIVTVETIE